MMRGDRLMFPLLAAGLCVLGAALIVFTFYRVNPSGSRAGVTPAATQLDNPGYAKAADDWRHGAKAIAADAPAYWFRAAADLQAGLSTDARPRTDEGRATYEGAIGQLNDLTTLPVADETPAQQAQTKSDTEALNSFFGTPGLYF
jgi:hypothetical protein